MKFNNNKFHFIALILRMILNCDCVSLILRCHFRKVSPYFFILCALLCVQEKANFCGYIRTQLRLFNWSAIKKLISLLLPKHIIKNFLLTAIHNQFDNIVAIKIKNSSQITFTCERCTLEEKWQNFMVKVMTLRLFAYLTPFKHGKRREKIVI